MEWSPTCIVLFVMLAVPDATGDEPSDVVPSKNCTLPAAAAGLTVAVSVTLLPCRTVVGFAFNDVVVGVAPAGGVALVVYVVPSAEYVTNVDITNTPDVRLALHSTTNSYV